MKWSTLQETGKIASARSYHIVYQNKYERGCLISCVLHA